MVNYLLYFFYKSLFSEKWEFSVPAPLDFPNIDLIIAQAYDCFAAYDWGKSQLHWNSLNRTYEQQELWVKYLFLIVAISLLILLSWRLVENSSSKGINFKDWQSSTFDLSSDQAKVRAVQEATTEKKLTSEPSETPLPSSSDGSKPWLNNHVDERYSEPLCFTKL